MYSQPLFNRLKKDIPLHKLLHFFYQIVKQPKTKLLIYQQKVIKNIIKEDSNHCNTLGIQVLLLKEKKINLVLGALLRNQN